MLVEEQNPCLGVRTELAGHFEEIWLTSADVISGNFMMKCLIRLFKIFYRDCKSELFSSCPKYLGATRKADQTKGIVHIFY